MCCVRYVYEVLYGKCKTYDMRFLYAINVESDYIIARQTVKAAVAEEQHRTAVSKVYAQEAVEATCPALFDGTLIKRTRKLHCSSRWTPRSCTMSALGREGGAADVTNDPPLEFHGLATGEPRTRSLSTQSVGEEARWLSWVSRQFERIAGHGQEITMREFKAALNIKESFFVERFFALFDSDGNGTISLEELLGALHLLVHGSHMDKLTFLFHVYDVDGSGLIEPHELRTVLESCLRESAISLPEGRLEALTLALFEAADADQSGAITLQELGAELAKLPGVLEDLTISAASWLKPPCEHAQHHGPPRYLTRTYWQNNYRKLLFMAAYVCTSALLLGLGAHANHRQGPWVLMLRRCLTWLRATWVVHVLPIDQSVLFHQMVGYVLSALASVHSLCHVVNFVSLSRQPDARYSLWEFLLTTRPGIGWVSGSASVTGVLLQILVGLMLVCSSPCVRRGGHFEVFYWTHLCYLWVWLLLVLHTPHFWKWLAGPGALFLFEKLLGLARCRIGHTHITEVNLLPSKVTHLVIRRPQHFHFKPGDYIYLNVPAIAQYEWHPFTISSPPEQQETLWLHVRSMGQWTMRLYEYFSSHDGRAVCQDPYQRLTRRLTPTPCKNWTQHVFSMDVMDDPAATPAQEDVRLTSFRSRRGSLEEPGVLPAQPLASSSCAAAGTYTDKHHKVCNIKCYLDGPYGTATRQILMSEHAVLIGAGIGITPFASILQSCMYRYRMRKQTCPSCAYSWCESMNDHDMRLRKVDFFWINRDQTSFEWFVSLLTKLELEQADKEPEGRFLEMHMYMTSALISNDMMALGLQRALDLLAQKENRDSITGLRTRTQPGRPDWGKVFQKLADENKGKVQVFFCGAPALAKVIKSHCEQFNFKFFKENF
ncbi:NADPH oxidase 5 isoform X3 [Petromyzon marinus]|uniref:NADPH oxidase 5 isoform X3 n=1 Tax=Petromyzon marinus TaxID=7757 RepID=A0AAJ7SSA6_PETMA|nr:NADPH oxidase 5 isoform X3 [Petromyzon marinus]